MKHPEEAVALQAVEFWSTVCDEEIELAIEAADVSKLSLLFNSISNMYTGSRLWRNPRK